jgi:Hint domain-containing protein
VKFARGLSCLLLIAAIAGCGASRSPGTGHPLIVPELKYRLVDQVGRPLYCGPPVVRVPTPAQADQEVKDLRTSDPETFTAITARLHLDASHLTTDDELSILRQEEMLNAVPLQPQDHAYAFDYVASRSTPEHVSGTIDSGGAISLTRHDRVAFPGPGGCPICLAATTRIATPDGPLPITALAAGMRVWTLDSGGRRIAVPILRIGHTRAPVGHRVVLIRLLDGRSVQASPGHPTVDGRTVGGLRPGDPYDGSIVASAERISYAGDTWDLLPTGPTHAYWADGILLGSTLA